MNYIVTNISGKPAINLQATLSAASATPCTEVLPHHPITCNLALIYTEDNALACPHARAAPNDQRTQHCINQSIAMLMIEIAGTR